MNDISTSIAIEQMADIIADKVAERLAARAARRFLSREEYAQVTGLGKRTIDRAIAEGRLEVERSGRRVLIPVDAKIIPRGSSTSASHGHSLPRHV